jgi:hypothetical protein
MDIVIKKALYWPDGRTRKCSDKQVVEYTRERKSLMLQALLDKYNEDHNLSGVSLSPCHCYVLFISCNGC